MKLHLISTGADKGITNYSYKQFLYDVTLESTHLGIPEMDMLSSALQVRNGVIFDETAKTDVNSRETAIIIECLTFQVPFKVISPKQIKSLTGKNLFTVDGDAGEWPVGNPPDDCSLIVAYNGRDHFAPTMPIGKC